MGCVLLGIVSAISLKWWFPEDPIPEDRLFTIRKRGYLIALTEQNTLNYYIYRGATMGYQLTLLESLARKLHVRLRIISGNDVARLYQFLDLKAADILAINLPVTREGRNLVSFSLPLIETRMVLIRNKMESCELNRLPVIRTLHDFPSDTVYVSMNPFQEPLNQYFIKETHKRAILKNLPCSQEELIRLIAFSKISYALVHENLAMVYKRQYRNLDVSHVAFPLFSCGWGIPKGSDSLLTFVNNWISDIKNRGELNRIYLNYYANQRVIHHIFSEHGSINGNKLSPFDSEIKRYSRRINWDWRLIASLMYEESNFRQGLISSKNAYGLMQMIPETAAKFGMDSTSGTSRQILAGISYLGHLDRIIPSEVSDPRERVNFILASYNVGIGKVLTARERAKKYGKDPNRWNGSVDYYLLRRSITNPYGHTDSLSGFPIDYKTEGYVDDIVTRYYHYRNLIPY
jgi:membrane-bound lytic murein transglycosylase F